MKNNFPSPPTPDDFRARLLAATTEEEIAAITDEAVLEIQLLRAWALSQGLTLPPLLNPVLEDLLMAKSEAPHQFLHRVNPQE